MVNQEDSLYVAEKEADRNSIRVQTPAKDDSPQKSEAPFRELVYAAVVIVLVILVLIATFSFFFNMQEAIADLINPKYQALVKALFSLLVLVFGIYTIKRLFK